MLDRAGKHHTHQALFAYRQSHRAAGRRRRHRGRQSSDGPQLGQHGGAVAGASASVAGKHPSQKLVELLGQVRPSLTQPGRLALEHLGEHGDHLGSRKGGLSCQTLEEDTPESEDIGAGIDVRVARRLLG